MNYHYVTKRLLRIEEGARKFFERIPFLHAFLAGVGVILFWRGVWELADIQKLDPAASIVLGSFLLGGIGLFIQTFVGNSIIIKTVKKEEQTEKQTEKKAEQALEEVEKEEITLLHLSKKIDELNSKIDSLNK